MAYWTGKGYGISTVTDVTGRPLLTFQGPGDKQPFLLSDRVAQSFDFTLAQPLTPGAMKNGRMDSSVSSYIKTKLGGGPDDELDHKISLELGGSNAPSNLMIQPGIKAGASAASDTLENNLAIDVANGKISLLTAWRTLAEQKGFLLGEDTNKGTQFSLGALGNEIFNIAKNAITGIRTQQLSQQGIELQAQMKDDAARLGREPLNQTLQTKIVADNITNLQNTTGISQAEAAKASKSYLAQYAESKNIDPREIISGLNANIQKILNNSVQDPNLFGVPSTAIIKIIGALQSVSTISVAGGLVLAIIGIFLAGPETIVAALSGGLLESIGAIFGVSALTGIGLTSIAFGEALNVASIGLNMTIKSMYDNGYLLPSQNISALKDALAIQKDLAGFLPSTITTPAPSGAPQYSPAGGEGTIDGNYIFTGGRWKLRGGSASAPSTPPTLFVGHINNGTLTPVSPFSPTTASELASLQDISNAAQQNISAYLSSIAGLIRYRLALKNRVLTANGDELVGTITLKPTTVSKTGVQHFKKIHNKFAVIEIFAQRTGGGEVHIGEILLGPVDESKVTPSEADLASMSSAFSKNSITSSMAGVSSVTIAPNIVTLPNGQRVSIDASGNIIGPASAGAFAAAPETVKAVTPTTTAEPSAAPVPSPTEPTPQQLAARLNPTAVQIAVPLGGIFTALGDLGHLYRRDGNNILTYDVTQLLSPEEKRNAGNYGAQTGIAYQRLKSLFNLDYNSLPVVNMADFMGPFVHSVPPIPGGDDAAYQRAYWRVAPISDFINIPPATLQTQTING